MEQNFKAIYFLERIWKAIAFPFLVIFWPPTSEEDGFVGWRIVGNKD